MFYRVINQFECKGQSIDSRDFKQYARRKRSVELLESYKWVCWLSERTGIRLSTAISVAKQYGWVIEEINEKIRNQEKWISLDLFITNDPIGNEIAISDVVYFINNYNPIYEKNGIFINDGDDPYVWECIWEFARQNINPELPSRLFSCFLFDNLLDAENFNKKECSSQNQIVTIDIKENRNIYKFDMNWVTNVPITSTFAEAYNYASNYWKQKETKNPIWEYLCDCVYTPIAID